MVGKGSVNHNSRKFKAANVDAERSHLNVDYCNESIKEVYHKLFDDALGRYNAKQTRADRCIEDYYEKIRTSKQEKPFHELILQIGDKETMGAESENGQIAKRILDEYYREFQERNPNLYVFSAHLHMDEATPHLHIDFVPFTTGSKRGLDTRVSLKQALALQGFKGGSRGDTEWSQWVQSEKEQLAAVMGQYDIEWEHKGTHEKHLSVLDYKKKARSEEIKELEQQNQSLRAINEELGGWIAERQVDIQFLEKARQKAEKATESAEERAVRAEKDAERYEMNLAIIKPMMEEVDKELAVYKGKVGDILPKADTLELASSYRKNKALPFFQKMKNKIGTMAAALYEARQEIFSLKKVRKSLEDKIGALQEENNYLVDNCDSLLKENARLSEIAKMFDRVTHVFGKDKVQWAVEADELRERQEQEAERRRRLSQPPETRSVREKLEWHKAHPEYRNSGAKQKGTKRHDMER